MTDKERIKIICDDARTITDNDHKVIRCHINVKNFDWLIDRARELESLKVAFDDLDSDYIDLQQENRKYREALEKIFINQTQVPTQYEKTSEIARKALEGTE